MLWELPVLKEGVARRGQAAVKAPGQEKTFPAVSIGTQ